MEVPAREILRLNYELMCHERLTTVDIFNAKTEKRTAITARRK